MCERTETRDLRIMPALYCTLQYRYAPALPAEAETQDPPVEALKRPTETLIIVF